MNILFVTYDIPYPLTSGGRIRSYHLIKQLAKKHTVSLFPFYRKKEQLKNLKNLPFIADSFPSIRRELTAISSLLYLPFYPFPAALYFAPSVKNRLVSLIHEKKFDAVHFESFYTSAYIDESINIPQILGTENIEWRVYQQYAKQQTPLFRPFLDFEIGRMRRFEKDTWKKASYCLAASEENAQEIRETDVSCEVIPNGIEPVTGISKRVFGDTVTFLFVGSLAYIQNKDALSWLVSSIWPGIRTLIEKQGKRPHLVVAGPYTNTYKTEDSTVELLGEVADISTVYRSSDIFLAPVRAGSGTKFKVLEAAGYGLPTVSTKGGVEGIEGIDDKKEIMIANTEKDFIDAVSYLLSHEGEAVEMGNRARGVVESRYSWDTIGEKLLKFYEKVVDHHR